MACLLCLVVLLADTGAMAASGNNKPLPDVQKQDDIAKLVPPSMRDKGKIIVVMTTSSPPAHFTSDEGNMEGLDYDLAVSIAKVLGLKPEVKGVPIDQVIPGLQAHRYDVVISQFKPTPERGNVLDFVDYAQSGTSLGVLAGNPEDLSPDNLCGAKIGVQKGSSQAVGMVPKLSDECTEKGRDSIDLKTFRDSTTALLALRSKRVDGVLIDSPVMGYAAQQSSKVEVAGAPLKSNPVAIGAVKGSGLIKPIQRALEYLHKNGAYQQIFENWGMRDSEISNFAINQLQSD
jgi:polar amino acid transport system substrate-binding protein